MLTYVCDLLHVCSSCRLQYFPQERWIGGIHEDVSGMVLEERCQSGSIPLFLEWGPPRIFEHVINAEDLSLTSDNLTYSSTLVCLDSFMFLVICKSQTGVSYPGSGLTIILFTYFFMKMVPIVRDRRIPAKVFLDVSHVRIHRSLAVITMPRYLVSSASAKA